MSINEKLLVVQKEWISKIVTPFIERGYDEQFSRPFHCGISEELDSAKNLIMIVGQEADCFWKYEESELTPEYIQNWCVGYFDKQIYKKVFAEYDVYNASAFWRFFRMLYQEGFDLCWNNLDKLHRYKKISKNGIDIDATETMLVKYERELSVQYGEDNKSLLQREIEIVKPDVVVFLTGPNYRESMCTAFGLEETVLDDLKPSKKNYCTQINQILGIDVPVFWTYHPGYLSKNSGFMEGAVMQISNTKIVEKKIEKTPL